ncbi:MAG: CoA-binding protein [Acidobacteriia bacterium]|nr:CoA-binding protein [Terriglobia bacterium]
MTILLPEVLKSSPDPLLDILKESKSIAVVGISRNPLRASNEIAQYLLAAGYDVAGVNPGETEVLGRPCYARVEDIPEAVDIVDIFRKSEDVPPVVESAIRKGAKVIWMQQGIENQAAAEKALAAGMIVVMDSCILVEHRRRLRELAR